VKSLVKNIMLFGFALVLSITAFPIHANANSQIFYIIGHGYFEITHEDDIYELENILDEITNRALEFNNLFQQENENKSIHDLRNRSIDARFITCPICRNGWLSQREQATPWGTTTDIRAAGSFPNAFIEVRQFRNVTVWNQCDNCGFSTPQNTRQEERWVRQ